MIYEHHFTEHLIIWSVIYNARPVDDIAYIDFQME